MIVRSVGWDDAAGVALRAAQRVEIAERYGTDDSEPGPAPTADDITVFFVAFGDDGTPPTLPDEIVERTAARYRELIERLTA